MPPAGRPTTSSTVCENMDCLVKRNDECLLMSQLSPTLENLSRLASKPGVEYTLVLSKTDGSIIRSSSDSGNARGPASSVSGLGNGSGDERLKSMTNYDTDTKEKPSEKSVEDIARMVFSFVSAAGALVEDMDSEDDLKLLRLRTRKNEIVIVPGQSVLFMTKPAAHLSVHASQDNA